MDELLRKFIAGEITPEEYVTLKNINSGKNISASAPVERALNKEQSKLSDYQAFGDTSKDLTISPDEMESYQSKGILPSYGSDYEDERAWRQSAAEKWGNGTIKLVGKTATALAGGLGMIPLIAANVIGQIEDGAMYLATGREGDTSFHEIYDNAYINALNKANESMDKALPHYITKASEDYNLLQSLGTANFWSNDFLQGASFVAGALLTEGAMVGLVGLSRTNTALGAIKKLSYGEKAAEIATNIATASKYAGLNKGIGLARQISTGAGYEASIEANHFVEEAKNEFINKYIEENGKEPDANELAEAMDSIYRVGNSVFGINLGLVSIGNMVALPKTFGPGIARRLGLTDELVDSRMKDLVNVADLSESQLARAAKTTGKTIKELTEQGTVQKYAAMTTAEKIASRAYKSAKPMLVEGFFEEGLQGVVNKGGLDYISTYLNPESAEHTASIADSFVKGFGATYGLDQAEGWKEIVIGAILGGIGGPNIGRKKGDPRWQGGITEGFKNPMKDEALDKLITKAQNSKATQETIKYLTSLNTTQDKLDAALAEGSMKKAKDAEFDQFHAYVGNKLELGRFNEIEDELAKQISSLSNEEFAQQFGYENMSDSELSKRKSEVVNKAVEKAKDIRKGYDRAKSIAGDDYYLMQGLAHIHNKAPEIDRRREDIAKLLSDKMGRIYDTETVSQMASFVKFINSGNEDRLNDFKRATEYLEKATEQELKSNKNKTSTDIMDRGKELEILEKEVEEHYNTLKKEFTSFMTKEHKDLPFKAPLDTKEFEKAFTAFEQTKKDIENTVGEKFYKNPEISNILNDLKELDKEREQAISQANYFFSKEGKQSLTKATTKLKELFEEDRISNEMVYAQEQFMNEKRETDKAREVAAEAYRIKVRNLLGVEAIRTQSLKSVEGIKELKALLSSINKTDPQEIEALNTTLDNISSFLTLYDLSNEEGKAELLSDNLKKFLLDFKEAIENISLTNPELYKSIIDNKIYNRIKEIINTFKEESKGTKGTGLTNPVNASYKYLQTMEWVDEKTNPNIKEIKRNATDIPTKATVKVVRESTLDSSGNFVPDYLKPNSRNKTPMDGEVKVAVGIPELKTSEDTEDIKYSIHVMYEGQHIGYLNTPNKYKFGNKLKNFDPTSMEDLQMLNSSYVTTNTNGELIPTPDGNKFISIYKLHANNFNNLLDKLKTKPELNNQELSEIFEINIDTSGMESEGISIQELSKVANGSPITDLSTILKTLPDGIPSKGIIIYNSTNNKFFLYDNIENKSYEIPGGYNVEIKNNFKPVLKAVESNFSLAALYQINNKAVFTAIKEPEIDSEGVNFSEKIINAFSEVMGTIQEKVKEGTLSELFDGSKKITSINNPIYKEFRFTTMGGNYKLGFSLKKQNGIHFVEMQISMSGTYIPIGIFNLKGDPILYSQGKALTETTQGFLFNENTLSFTKQGLKHGNNKIVDSKDLIKALNSILNSKFTHYQKITKEGKPTSDSAAFLEAASYEENGTLNLKTIQSIKKSFRPDELSNEIVNFKTLKLPDLKIVFTGKSGIDYEGIDRLLDIVNSLTSKSNLAQMKDAKEGLIYFWNNKTNNETKLNYNIKYTNALEKLDKLITEKESFLNQQSQPTSTTPTTPSTTLAEPTVSLNTILGGETDAQQAFGSPFFTSATEFKELEEINNKRERLESMLPDFITVRDIETIREGLSQSGFTYGMFRDSVIYLSQKAPKGVEYHEAFHAVFRVLLTDNQIIKILQEAKTRYGIPTKQQLDELKSKSSKYENLTKEQLSNLWYEEKLADEFMDNMNNKPVKESFFKKMINKINQFIKWLTGLDINKGSLIDSLFNDISTGKFRKAPKVKQSIIPLNQNVFKLIQKPDGSFLTASFSDNVMKKVFFQVLNFKNNNGYITDEVTNQLIDLTKAEIFSLSNYSELIENLINKGEDSEAYRIQSLIKDINSSLEMPKNKEIITAQINSMLPLYKFQDYDIIDDEQDTSPTSLIQKPNQSVGGPDSLSKSLRHYIMFTQVINDPFGFKLSQTELEALANEDKPYSKGFINYVDGNKIHGALERMLVNTEREDFLNKFYELSNDNPEIHYIYKRLVKDIYNDLNRNYNDSSIEEILELPITELAKSVYFRMFVAGYTKHKVDSILNRFDKESKDSKVHRSNLNDVKDNQYRIWYDDNRSSNFNLLSEDEVDDIFSNIIDNLQLSNLDDFEQRFNIVKENLNRTSLIFSDKFIKLSMINANPGLFNNLTEGSELFKLKKLYDSYKDLNYITPQEVLNIRSSITFNKEGKMLANHFTKTKEDLEKDTEVDTTNIIVNEDKLGAVSTIKDLAESNAMFDLSIAPSTFTNVNNEKVYNHLYPNYISSFALALRNKFSQGNLEFMTLEFEKGFEIFKDLMIESKLYSELEDDSILRAYFKAIRNNPILQDTTLAKTWLENFTVYIADGLKQQDLVNTFKGTEYADSFYNLDSRAKLLYHLNLYADNEFNSINKKVDGVNFYPEVVSQNEGKQTQWAYLVPRQTFVNDYGDLTNKAYTYYDTLLKYELDSIREAYNNLVNNSGIIEKYDLLTGKDIDSQLEKLLAKDETLLELQRNYRGLKLIHFEVLKNIDSELYKEVILKTIQDPNYYPDSKIISDLVFNYHSNEFIEFIKSDEIKLISKKENLLPESFIKNNVADEVQLKKFFTNYFFNSASVNNLMWGNLNMELKNSTDLFKRNAGPNAAGPSIGFGNSNVVILDDVYEDADYGQGRSLGNTETTNAQSNATLGWYLNQYLPTFGKWNPEIESIYEKILLMEDITPEELELLQDTGSLLNPRKTSAFTFNFYGKTSTAILTRKEVSYVPKELYDEFAEEVVKLLPSSGMIYGTEEYNNLLRSLQKYYKPRRGTEKLHNMLNKMENSNTDLVFFRSAIKSIASKVQNVEDDSYSPMSIPNEFIREQVVTDSVKDEIIHGTQLMQLIWSEQLNDNLELNFNGKQTTLGDLRSTYKNLLGWRVKEGYNKLEKAIIKNDKAAYQVLLKSFEQSIIEQGADPALLELFSSLGELPKYNLNFPRTLGMFQKMFLAFVSKTVFSRKTAGHKFTLRSDYGHNVVRDSSGKVVSRQDYNNDPEKYENYNVDRLRYQVDPNNPNVYYAECKIPVQLANLLEIDENGFINSKSAEMLGVRIPTQDKHSMVYLKVVEVLPAELGPQIIMPREIINLSGADFDIDSEFARALEHFINVNNEIVSFGSYLTSSNPYEQAYSEFLESVSNSSEIKVKINSLIENSEDYKNTLIATQKNNIVIRNNSRKLRTLKKEKASKKEIKELRELIKKQKAHLKEQKNSLKLIKFNYLQTALKEYDYPSTFDEFKVIYKNQIDSNIINLNNGKASSINPITMEEANNYLLDIEKMFVRNRANDYSIAMQPASDTKATSFMSKFYSEETGIKDPLVAVDFSTITAVVKASNANAIGQQNIGIAAVANIMFQYLVNNKVEVYELGFIDSYSNESNERINDLISTVITMAVDNAKEQYAIRFNLTPATQGVYMNMLMLKEDFDLVSAMMVQPSLERYSKLEAFLKSPIKSKKEEGESKGNLKDLIAEYKVLSQGQSFEENFPEGLTYNALVKAKQYYQKVENGESLTEDDLTELQFNLIQYEVLLKFAKNKQAGDQLFHFSRVISLIKGLKPGIYEGVYNVMNSLEDMGVKAKLDNGKLYLTHTPEYLEKPENFPIDFLPLLNNESFLKEELTAFFKVHKNLDKFFLSETKFAKEIFEDVLLNTKSNITFENKEQLIRLINGFLTIKSFSHVSKFKFDFNDLIGTETKETLLVSKLKKLKKDSFWGTNAFIKFLTYDKISYKNKEGNSLNNKTTYTLKTDSFATLSPNQVQMLMDSFQQLIVSTDSEVQDFGYKALVHVISKDLAMYKNNSYVSVIPPAMFTKFTDILNNVHDKLQLDNPNYQDLFGANKEEILNEFTEKFIRDINNRMSLISTKTSWMFSNISRALRYEFAQLSTEEKVQIQTSGLFSTELMVKISDPSLEFTKEDYEILSPLKINDDGSITLSIFTNYDPNNKAIVKFNKNVLSSTGLFKTSYVEAKPGVFYSTLLFPKGFSLNNDSKKNSSFKLYLRRTIKQNPAFKNPNAGLSATYYPVDTIGSKLILPYAYNINQMTEKAVVEEPEKVEEKPVISTPGQPKKTSSDLNIKSKKSFSEQIKNLNTKQDKINFFKNFNKQNNKFQIELNNNILTYEIDINSTSLKTPDGSLKQDRYVKSINNQKFTGGELTNNKDLLNGYTIAESIVTTILNIEKENIEEFIQDLLDLNFTIIDENTNTTTTTFTETSIDVKAKGFFTRNYNKIVAYNGQPLSYAEYLDTINNFPEFAEDILNICI